MMLERILAWMKDGGTMPVCRTLGIKVEAVEAGFTRCSLEASDRHFNAFGTVHGGVLCDLADMAMGTAFMTTLHPGQALATIELKINYLRPARSEVLIADAKVVHRGRTTGLVECSVTNGEGKLVARATSTCMVVMDERADVWHESQSTQEKQK